MPRIARALLDAWYCQCGSARPNKEHVLLASVSALGAIREFTVGVFLTDDKKYLANSFSGVFEIVSLTGTVTTKEGSFYPHLHMSAGNERGEVFGGHLNRAVVSATVEMVVTVMDGTVERCFDEYIGLNLLRFKEALIKSDESGC